MFRKFLSFIAVAAMLVTFLFIAPVSAKNDNGNYGNKEPKQIHTATLDQDFVDNEVIVTLFKDSSYINKKYDLSYFSETDNHNVNIILKAKP